MFVLIWMTLLCSVRGITANSEASVRRTWHCQSDYCVNFYENITAEAGLCVEISCSFITSSYFKPTNLVWYKCESSRSKCGDSDIILHTNNENKVQSRFRGRVSLLEPKLHHGNCSIIISNLQESDSGSYQLRVNGYVYGRGTGFTYNTRTTVHVRALQQKPTLVVPPLTEGQQTTLTCTAPGLCPGSPPNITWRWRGEEEEDFNITGNITAVTQTHSSTLTFNPSAEHHGTNITCKISFTGDTTTEETVTLNVTYVKELRVDGDTSVKEGETLNLTCSVESFPASVITWTKDETGNHFQNTKEDGISSLSISNVTRDVSGLYICTAAHVHHTLTKKINVTVTYREPRVTGETTVKEGKDLNLTCSVESFSPPLIKWTKHSENKVYVQTDSGSASLLIPNVKTEHAGRYICTVERLDEKVSVEAEVTVTWFSDILKGSGCVLQSEVLTCVCVSEGFPLPTIRWSLLKNHTEYSVTTKVSNHTVNSSVTISRHGNISVECFSSNGVGEATENLIIQQVTSENAKDQLQNSLDLNVIIAFLIGVSLSAAIFCAAMKCCRKKKKNPENMETTMEMMAGQQDPPIYDDQAVYGNNIHIQAGTENQAVAAEKSAPEPNRCPRDVEYANIDFSKLKKRSCRKEREATMTEYAEIKTGVKEQRHASNKEDAEMLGSEEVELVTDDDNGIKQCVSEEQEAQVEALYSTVKDVMEI
ncbi:sialic acid-binding Ig-like lectin 5 [Nothobranchius furzeri]